MKKRYWVLIVIIVILVGVRLALPYWAESTINSNLKDLNGYTGSVTGVEISLLQGYFGVDSLVVYLDTEEATIPFLFIEKIDSSVDWGHLISGAIVGNVVLNSPAVNLLPETLEMDPQYGLEVNWSEVIQQILPVRINVLRVEDGTIRYRNMGTEPEVDLALTDLNLEVLNITNVEQADEDLPTRIEMSATTSGNGLLNLSGDANFLKEIPDLDLAMELEDLHLPDLNEFLEAYARVDAESGEFFLYSDFVMNDGVIEGYVQPMIYDLSVLDLGDEDHDLLSGAWELIVEGVTQLFRFHPDDQFATRVPISGEIDDPEAGIFTAAWNVFRNAFIEAFEQSVEDVIDFEEADPAPDIDESEDEEDEEEED